MELQRFKLKHLSKIIFLTLTLLAAFDSIANAAQNQCSSIFKIENSVFSHLEPISTDSPKRTHLGVEPQEIRNQIAKDIFQEFTNFADQTSAKNFDVGINLSPKNNLHIVSKNLSTEESARLVEFVKTHHLVNSLESIPKWFRNKYFHIQFVNGKAAKVSTEFSWEFSPTIANSMISGFAQKSENGIRRFNYVKQKPQDVIRFDLLNQKRSQDTLATCGLSSMLQVLSAKGIKTNEADLLSQVQVLGIKQSAEFFGQDPGIPIEKLYEFATVLGKKYGFSVEKKHIQNQDDANTFMQLSNSAAANNKLFLIVNYKSPVVGRPGDGHYSPIGGFNSSTREVLLSETNLVANPPYWVSAKSLATAIQERGYLVIRWK